MSGHSSTGELKPIDEAALSKARNRNVLVLNLSWDDVGKTSQKREFFSGYLRDLEAMADFVSEWDSQGEIDLKFANAGLVYVPGGDTLTLIRNLRNKDLVRRLLCFEGVISGNSAGAYAVCPSYIRIRDGELSVVHSTGVVPVSVKCHYSPEQDPLLLDVSREIPVYALDVAYAVVVDGRNKQFIGDVWKFESGRKERL